MNPRRLVTVDHVSLYYGRCRAVDDLSFSVGRGEVVGLLGINGSGKSSTMQMISGVLPITLGQISVAGYDLLKSAKDAKRHIGFLPDQAPLYPRLTVDEYLAYAARLRGLRNPKLQAAVDYVKQRCGLTDIGRRLIKNLSRGMQQRVGIAQAIIHDPAVVILDEPTVALDVNQIVAVRSLIRELGVEHGVILSTHILAEAQAVCDRVLIIDQGKLVFNEYIGDLQKDADTLAIQISLQQPPSVVELAAIAGVNKVEQISAQQFTLYCQSGMAVAECIIRSSLEGQWQLYEMMPVAGMLEDIFVRLTRGEHPVTLEAISTVST